MSINRNRKKYNLSNNNHEYRILWLKDYYPPYWDDGTNYHHEGRIGFKHSNKCIMNFQYRMYRTWKHNRKTQWK
jgi:hypothetical protein